MALQYYPHSKAQFIEQQFTLTTPQGLLSPWALNVEQQYMLRDMEHCFPYINNVFTKPRQSGISTMMMAYCLMEVVTGNRKTVMVMGANQAVTRHLNSIAQCMVLNSIFTQYTNRITSREIDFNGDRIVFETVSPVAGCGLNIDLLYVDEVDFCPAADMNFWHAMWPCMVGRSKPGKVILSSSLGGHSSLYHAAKTGQINTFQHTDLSTLAPIPLTTVMSANAVPLPTSSPVVPAPTNIFIDAYDRAMRGI